MLGTLSASESFRRIFMTSILTALARSLIVSALATLSFATVTKAQPYGPGQRGGMMDGGWGWGMGYGMGGFGGIGVLVLALIVLGIGVIAFRRRNP